MHELSMALDILDIVRRAVRSDARRVERVHVQVGVQSGVVPDSLAFSFDAVTAGTPLEGVSLEIERIPFRLHCDNCSSICTGENGMIVCPQCGSTRTIILSGTELRVTSIEIEDESCSVRSGEDANRSMEAT
jgi:hydrogenase nickel incorporation protein HypA/HybF